MEENWFIESLWILMKGLMKAFLSGFLFFGKFYENLVTWPIPIVIMTMTMIMTKFW